MILNKIKKIICIIFLISINYGCSQTINVGPIKWISKYSFYDLYKDKINILPDDFLPTDDAKFKIFQFVNKNTIIVGGTVPQKDKTKNIQTNQGTIFVSKDQGKSYQEIIFPEEEIKSVSASEKYGFIETNSNGFSPLGKNVIYLLDFTTLQYKKIDEYPSNSKISYKQFNGEYVIYTSGDTKKLLNVFSKEEYLIPDNVTANNFILDKNNTIVFLKNGNKVFSYNAKNAEYKTLKELKGSYTSVMNTFGEVYLGKTNSLKTSGTVYSLHEKELFEVIPKNEKGVYRYKNFACYFKETRPYTTIYFSYDYGKTWNEYHTKDFFTTVTPKGFYKDELILLDVGFYDKKDNSHILVGEFQK